jgi:hypothetical protein
MGIAGWILGMSFRRVAMVVALCVFAEVLVVLLVLLPAWEKLLREAAEKYDVYFPEIVIQNGQASIREKQPYSVQNLDEQDLVLVIDTTITSYDQALKLLQNTSYGAVLTRTTIVSKDRGEVKIISLKDFPDMTLNSESIKRAIDTYAPMIRKWGTIILLFFFTLTKLTQACLFAFIPYVMARIFNRTVSYESAFKLSSVCLIVPVGVNLFLSFVGSDLSTSIFAYYVIYTATLAFMMRDFLREERRATYH